MDERKWIKKARELVSKTAKDTNMWHKEGLKDTEIAGNMIYLLYETACMNSEQLASLCEAEWDFKIYAGDRTTFQFQVEIRKELLKEGEPSEG